MESPLAIVCGVGRIGGRFQPAFRRDDIRAAIAIDIPRPDAMPVALLRNHVLHPLVVLQFEPCQRNIDAIEFGQDLESLAIIIQIHQESKFRGAAVVNFRSLPFLHRRRRHIFARILQPHDIPRKIPELNQIHVAIPIYVDGQIAEIVYIVVSEIDIPDLVFFPVGRFIPAIAGNDIRAAVFIDVHDRRRFGGPRVNHPDLKRQVRRTAGRSHQRGGKHSKNKRLAHGQVLAFETPSYTRPRRTAKRFGTFLFRAESYTIGVCSRSPWPIIR